MFRLQNTIVFVICQQNFEKNLCNIVYKQDEFTYGHFYVIVIRNMLRKEKNMFEYILFDLDGTLTDPKVGITTCVQYALKHFGIDEPDNDKLTPFIGPPLTDSYKDFYGFTDEQAQIGLVKYRERFSTIGWMENEIYPGMEDMLKMLHEKGIKLAVASSKPRVFVEKILDYFHIQQYFAVVSGAELDGSRNNKQAVMKEAFVRLGIIKGVEADDITDDNYAMTDDELAQIASVKCAMVGDRKFDVNGAKALGVTSVAVSYGYAPEGELEACEPDYLVDTVEELGKVLAQD